MLLSSDMVGWPGAVSIPLASDAYVKADPWKGARSLDQTPVFPIANPTKDFARRFSSRNLRMVRLSSGDVAVVTTLQMSGSCF